jgi:hypothetical protein
LGAIFTRVQEGNDNPPGTSKEMSNHEGDQQPHKKSKKKKKKKKRHPPTHRELKLSSLEN